MVCFPYCGLLGKPLQDRWSRPLFHTLHLWKKNSPDHYPRLSPAGSIFHKKGVTMSPPAWMCNGLRRAMEAAHGEPCNTSGSQSTNDVLSCNLYNQNRSCPAIAWFEWMSWVIVRGAT